MSNWHILGAGALGCLWASYLHKAGHKVELLLKNEAALSRYREADHITLTQDDERKDIPARASTAGQGETVIDQLLITTKAHQTMTAMHAAANRLSADCSLLLVQNGMGVAEQLAAEYPRHELYCAVTTDGAYCPEAFTVVHAGRGNTFVGSYQNQHDPGPLSQQLPGEYLAIQTCDDIEARQWQKLAVNCAVNGLTVVFHCRNGGLLEDEAARKRLWRLCHEIASLGAVLGFEEWRDTLYQNTESVIRLTAANYSSMYQDINNRRITEIDYINGYLIKQAEKHGIACPENEALYQEIKQKEQELNCR